MKRLFNIQGLFGRKSRRIKELEKALEKEAKTTKIHKDYIDELLEDLSNKKEKIEKLEREVKTQHEGFMASVEEKCEITKENEVLNKKLDQLKEKAKTEKKELKDKIKELEKELDKRYIVKKVRASKPTKQTMNIKSSVKQSNAIKLVKEKL